MKIFHSLMPQTAVLALLCAGLLACPNNMLAQVVPSVPTGSMTTARYDHTATLLNNGKVLITGGRADAIRFLASAELYDPATRTFTATGSMTTRRASHTATLLTDGKVLVVGGDDLGTAELYDPATGTFTATGNTTAYRAFHTATLLSNGKVLIAGGLINAAQGFSTNTAELYDPATGTFTATGSMITSRASHTATLLTNGKVLVVGGDDLGATASAELYDPTTGIFTATGSMNLARSGHTATLLNSGTVLVAGGNTDLGATASAEVYDPIREIFTFIPTSLTAGREFHTATLLNNGTVLIAGGNRGSGSADLMNPATETFTAAANMVTARYAHTATLLKNGTVLVAGGKNNLGALSSAELYDMPAGSTCGQNLAIGTFTLCGEIYNDVSTGENVKVNYSPSSNNAIIAWATWCFTSSCNSSISGVTATIGDNINATESCFVASPHSPFITDANGGGQGSGDFQEHYVWYCPSIPSGVTSFTVTPSNPNLSYVQLNITEWKAGSLAASCSPISACFENVDNLGEAGNSTGGTTAAITTNGPTLNSNDLVFAVTEVSCCSFTASPGTGYTGITVAPSVTPGMVSEAKAAASGIQTATTTWTGGSTPWFGVIVPLIGTGTAPAVAMPTFSPGAGTYSSAQTVTISSTTSGATICYTTDGSTPAANTPGTCSSGTSLPNGETVAVTASETLKAIGTESGFANSGVGSAAYTLTIVPAPSIASLSLTSGSVGTAVTISGSNFGSSEGSSTVTFNGTTAIPTSWSATSIVAPVPAGATTGNVVVTVSGMSSNGIDFTVTGGATSPAVAFIGFDTGTQGNWQGKYGSDAYFIASGPQSSGLSYGTFAVQNDLLWTWAASTTDPRALTVPGGSTGIASCWYNNPAFSFDINLTDGNTHQIALYAVDWDVRQRAETIQIVDANNSSNVLSTQSISSFSGGTYLVWSVSGHVIINVTLNSGSGPNAVISGVFFSSPNPTQPLITSPASTTFVVGSPGTFTVTATGFPTPMLSEAGTLPSGVTFNATTGVLSGTPAAATNGSYPLTFTASNSVNTNTQDFSLTVNPAPVGPSASFVGTDTTTQGNWQGKYGSDGYGVPNGGEALPSYDPTLSVNGENTWTWASNPTDTRAPETGTGGINARTASCWYSGTSFSFDVNIITGTHQVALYLLDYDNQGRSETVQVLDSSSGMVLDTRTIPDSSGDATNTNTTSGNFIDGTYLIWTITGHVTIVVTRNAGPNGVVSGIFFGGSGTPPPPSPSAMATWVKSDTGTQGAWIGKYGTQGSSLANSSQSFSVPATLLVQNQSNWTWAVDPNDTRALETDTHGDSLAAAWYSRTTFTMDLNLTDGAAHNVELYVVDWDSQGRTETLQIKDANSGAMLDTRVIPDSSGDATSTNTTSANFVGGTYLIWTVTGHVTISVTMDTGPNAVVSGLFIDP
jgi:hypothetical protein